MTGPLAPLFAQVRKVVPSSEEIEQRIYQAEVVLDDPDEYPREYVGDARREIALCKHLLVADAALSAIERHVQDMEKALAWYAERRNYLPPAGDSHTRAHPATWVFEQDSFDGEGPGARARAALPASDTRNRVAREKEEE